MPKDWIRRQTHRAVARVLGDLLAALFAFLGQLLEVRHDRLQQLEDDRGADVGHDAQREDRGVAEVAAYKEIVQPKNSASAASKEIGQCRHIDAGRGDVTTNPVHDKQQQRKNNPLLELRNLKHVGHLANHLTIPGCLLAKRLRAITATPKLLQSLLQPCRGRVSGAHSNAQG